MVVIESFDLPGLRFQRLEKVAPSENLSVLFFAGDRVVGGRDEGAEAVVLRVLRAIVGADYCTDFSESELPELSEVTNVGPPEGGKIDPFVAWVAAFVGRYLSLAAWTSGAPR